MPTILFVEDQQTIGESAKEYLEEFKDHQVTWLDRGDTAYELLSQPAHDFDCIIVDLTLPGKHGLEILQALRTWDKNTPVIICSAVELYDEKCRCLDAGATEFVTKPFELEALSDLIEKLVKVPETV